MDKKIIFGIILILLIQPLVFAQNQQTKKVVSNGPGSSQTETTQTTLTSNQYGQVSGENGVQTGNRNQIQTRTHEMNDEDGENPNINQVRERIREREQQMLQEMEGLSDSERKVYQNQNQVRLTVHALLEMENLTGGIGKNVSAIARQFNNSIQATIRSEERINKRSRVARFLFGGDIKSANEIEEQVNQNRIRIRELNSLMLNCSCDPEVKEMLRQQIQLMEQEQVRLENLAKKERENKGIFGWIVRR
ncbi:MAG: hypothetical protein QXY45_03740 [Candidatus Aenigmatarchaeota archaeon]